MTFNEDTDEKETVLELLESKEEKSKNGVPSVLEPPPLLFSKRLLVTVLLFINFVNFQVLRNNMNIAVVEMTSNKSIIRGNTTFVQPPEFDWDSPTIGLVTSIINYGGLLAFLNGFIIIRLGSATCCAISMFLAGVATLLHPVILRQSFYAFFAWRFLTGIFEAIFYASTSPIFSNWFPVKERSTLIAFSFNGTNAGVAIVYPFCGYLAHRWGWPMVFYVTGAESIILSVLFLVLVKNHPTQDEKISKAELAYILQDKTISRPKKENNDGVKKNGFDVFKPILTSGPIWSFFNLIFTYMFIATVITACLPLYVKDLTGKESDEIGYISSIPNAVFIFMFPVTGALMDFVRNHSSTTTTRVIRYFFESRCNTSSWVMIQEVGIHKIMVSVAYISAVVFFVAVTFVTDITTSFAFFVLIQICMSFVPLIIPMITINIAPSHVSYIAGMNTNFFCFGAIAAQTITGFMTTNHSIQEWNNCFLLTAAVAVIGNVVVLIFGSSDPQPWSLPSTAKEERALSGEKPQSEDD